MAGSKKNLDITGFNDKNREIISCLLEDVPESLIINHFTGNLLDNQYLFANKMFTYGFWVIKSFIANTIFLKYACCDYDMRYELRAHKKTVIIKFGLKRLSY
jgi:hypothetical protein